LRTLEVVFAPAAGREIRKLPRNVQEQVIRTLESLSITPRPRGVEKLQGHPRFYRITVGKSHRLIYHILREKLIIVLLIRDRKDAYKAIDDLDGKLEVALLHIEDVVTTKLRKVGK
jgi:mRNA interferase RelE/StbE